MRAQSQGGARGKGTKRTKAQGIAYLALHGTDLARAIAAGAIHALLGGPEQEQRVVFVDTEGIAQALGNARQGRDYGVIALVEIPREHLSASWGDDKPSTGGTLPYIPLALVSRILFQSAGDRDEFKARASGYGDVPVEILQYDIEPALFAQATPVLFPEPDDTRKEGTRPCPGAGEARDIDKLAGAASAYLAAARGLSGDIRIAADLEIACKGSDGEGLVGRFVGALALRLDTSMDSEVNANILAKVARTLASMNPNAGFDAEVFLASLGEMFDAGSSEKRIAEKFVDRAQAILAGNTEVAGDAFADSPGKTILRALLLFLLNPDAGRLQSIGKRLEILGPSVRMLASALAGCLSGFTALTGTLKAPSRDSYLAVPLMALLIRDGRFVGFDSSQSWGGDGSGEAKVCLQGYAIMEFILPASPGLVLLRDTLAGLGVSSSIDKGNGGLTWMEPLINGAKVQSRPCTVPIFPARGGIEIFTAVQAKSSRRDSLASIANINARARESRVFATGVPKGRSLELELCVICESVEKDTVISALKALAAEVEMAVETS